MRPAVLTIHTPDARFWSYHLWLPLIISTATLYIFEYLPLDLVFADLIYTLEGGSWSLRKNWFFYDVMHHWGKQLLILSGLIVLGLYISSFKLKALHRWRWSLGLSILTMILLPITVAELKHLSGVPCPWNLSQFGGNLPYLHNFQYAMGQNTGHCFPAGHSSGGFALFGIYFAFWPFFVKKRYLFLIPALLTGTAFGLAQQIRGAHFISHDLWSAVICWFGALALLQLALQINPPGRNLSNTDKGVDGGQTDDFK